MVFEYRVRLVDVDNRRLVGLSQSGHTARSEVVPDLDLQPSRRSAFPLPIGLTRRRISNAET